MSPISNDSIRGSFPFLATISNDANDLAFPSKRITMDTMLANATITVPTHLAVLGGSDREFSEVLDALRAELAPIGLVEALMVDRVVLAVSRLRELVGSDGDAETTATLIAQAEQSLDRALAALSASKAGRNAEGWGRPAVVSSRIGDVSTLPPLPCDDEPVFVRSDRPAAVEAEAEAVAVDGHWRDRLIFDENVSDESPVVRGTWVTAGQVVSLIVDGMTWDDILRSFPELTERDIRACLAYTVEQDGPIAF